VADGDGSPQTDNRNPDGKGGKSGGGFLAGLIAVAVALTVEAIKALIGALQGRSIVGEISNNTGSTLNQIANHHESGGFNQAPPPQIAPHTVVGFSSQNTAVLQGTVGSVTYAGDGFTVLLGWNNAEVGSNATNTTIDGPNANRILVMRATGSGNEGAHMQYWLFPHPDYHVKASLSGKAQNGVVRIRPLRPGSRRISVREVVSTLS
jgi:hypothetical protein